MNNNLIPEQRLDKNGRLNTKHVRATKPFKAGSVPPAPRLSSAPKAKLTKGQVTPSTRALDVHGPWGQGKKASAADESLCNHLGVSADSPKELINASDKDIYALLSVASNANAHALLRSGYRTAEDALGYLSENGFEHLIKGRSALCDEALNRRINPQKFLNACRILPSEEGSEHFMDAVEVYSSSYIMDGTVLAKLVYHGGVRIEDMKDIGFKEIGLNNDIRHITGALQRVVTDEPYTAADIKALLTKHPKRFADAMKLSELYGAETALTLNTIDMGYAEHLKDTATNERISVLLKYNDEINECDDGQLVFKHRDAYAKIERYHDAGVAPSIAAKDGCTDQQLEAIMSGMTAGVSSGWL